MAKQKNTLSTEERETLINIPAKPRDYAFIYSSDPYYQLRLERAGAEIVKRDNFGGIEYRIPAKQVSIRKSRGASGIPEKPGQNPHENGESENG